MLEVSLEVGGEGIDFGLQRSGRTQGPFQKFFKLWILHIESSNSFRTQINCISPGFLSFQQGLDLIVMSYPDQPVKPAPLSLPTKPGMTISSQDINIGRGLCRLPCRTLFSLGIPKAKLGSSKCITSGAQGLCQFIEDSLFSHKYFTELSFLKGKENESVTSVYDAPVL